MNNFTYYNPTRLVFGQGAIARLADLVAPDARVLLTFGGGSIKQNGVHDQVLAALPGRKVREFGGIQPNPLYETLMEAVKICQSEQIDLLLAVGGGSVLDGTKFIAAAACYSAGDPWDILTKAAPITAALPVGSVLTLPATGSEMNGFAVISRQSTQEKLAFGSEKTYPVFAILDPQTTMSLPTRQTRNGIVDAFVHVMEQYATFPADAPLQDRQAEAVLQTLIQEGPRVLAEPNSYPARANLMWSATQALNGLIGCGVPQDWATHMIGHELTAFYGVDHAESLAIVMPQLLRAQHATKAAKLEQFARRVWGVDGSDRAAVIETGIQRMEHFFHSLGMSTRLSAYRIAPAEAAAKVRDRFAARKTTLGEKGDLTPERVHGILMAC